MSFMDSPFREAQEKRSRELQEERTRLQNAKSAAYQNLLRAVRSGNKEQIDLCEVIWHSIRL